MRAISSPHESVRPQDEKDSGGARGSEDPEPILGDEAQEEGEEAQGPVMARIPGEPTQEEREEHMITHVPYRQWCQHCVSGKAKSPPHLSAAKCMREVPTLVLDYAYMRERQSEDEEQGMPILVGCDAVTARGGTGHIFARVVPAKGVNEYAVQCLSAEVAMLGHKELILKSDGEPAIHALKEAVKAERAERIVLERSPVSESRSNGLAENTIQLIQGQIRAMKHALESRLQTKISESACILPWLVMHAAGILNRHRVGKDGFTAYRRLKGKEFRRPAAEFGEAVLYLKPGTAGVDKAVCRWEAGIWLGFVEDSGEIIVGTELGVMKAYQFKRLSSKAERWNADKVMAVQGYPWQPVPMRKGTAIPSKLILDEPTSPIPPLVEEGEQTAKVVRRARISREEVLRFGPTINCPGCRAVTRGAQSENHTEACRARIEAEIIKQGGARAKIVQEGLSRTQKRGAHSAGETEESISKRRNIVADSGIGQKRSREGESAIEADRAGKYQNIEQEVQAEEEERKDMIDMIDDLEEGGAYWDDLSGKALDPIRVRAARQEEMGEIAKHAVYTKVPISEAWRVTEKGPIGTRWVDVNKGDEKKARLSI